MAIEKLKFDNNEMVERKGGKTKRYPNLSTVLMIEHLLKQHRDMPIKISEIKSKLPKKIMHQTLGVVLEYLWRSGKIIYGARGVQWIYSEPEHLKKMFEDTLEI